jgi:hypothetical protein
MEHETTMTGLTTLAAKIAVALAMAQAVVLPDDPRLEPVRPRLEELVGRTTRAGLPADLVVSKVREGLAKGVAADRIEAAAARLTDSLQTAGKFAAERRRGAPPPADLVRALAEAHLHGLDLKEVDPMVRSGRASSETARAIEVLTDLSRRGYPTARAAALVKEVFARDAGAVGRLPATLEVLRREQALSHAETVDALQRGMARGGSLDQASHRAAEEERHKGAPARTGREGREAAPGGKDGFVPPGQLKKQLGSHGPPAEPPGRGRGPR